MTTTLPGHPHIHWRDGELHVEKLPVAQLAREHNDANVLAMGARLIGSDMAKACVAAFLDANFAGGRHQRRVDQLSQLLQESD